MSRVSRPTPADLTPGWPETPSPDYAAEVARCLARNLRESIGDRSVRAVVTDCDVDEATVRRILLGSIWPDLRTIARLERALASALYPACNGATAVMREKEDP